jgi:hypothetical protein
VQEKTAKIRTLEKQEKHHMIDKDRLLALEEQVRQLQERSKNIQTDRDIVEQDKRMQQGFLQSANEKIKGLEERLAKAH